jgi:hypothetical protein
LIPGVVVRSCLAAGAHGLTHKSNDPGNYEAFFHWKAMFSSSRSARPDGHDIAVVA